MIGDLNRFLRERLIDELIIQKADSNIKIEFAQPTREWSGRLAGQPTINLFLYDLRENNVLRQHQWEQLPSTNGRNQPIKRTPYRIDFYYLITAWVNKPEDEHDLLTACLLAFLKYPLLNEEAREGTPLADQPFDIPIRVAAHDKLTNPAELWSSLNNELRPAISLVTTLAIDPWDTFHAPLVRLRRLHTVLGDKNAP